MSIWEFGSTCVMVRTIRVLACSYYTTYIFAHKICIDPSQANIIYPHHVLVWPVLSAFLPEARSAVDFVCDWIVDRKE